MRVFLNTDISVLYIEGPVMELRSKLPYLITSPAALVKLFNPVWLSLQLNAAALKKRSGATFANGSPTRFGRTIELLQTTVNGKPERAETIKFIWKPPKILSTTPPLFKNRCPLPNGKSIIALAESRWRASRPEVPWSAFKVKRIYWSASTTAAAIAQTGYQTDSIVFRMTKCI